MKKKVCLLGPFGVGKTSLISRFVQNIYSEKYLSTVGVKVDKKELSLGADGEVSLIIWDLEGRDSFLSVTDSYLRGMSGYLLVADGTREESLERVRETHNLLKGLFSEVPSILVVNKSDLFSDWKVSPEDYEDFLKAGIGIIKTSAKDGTGVEESFTGIARRMLNA